MAPAAKRLGVAADGKTVDPTSQEFFDALYAHSPDPWGFANAPFEVGRYEHLIDMLGGETFARAFEPGCSIGELTWRLAARCHSLLAIDISPLAVTRARARCAHLPHETPSADLVAAPEGFSDRRPQSLTPASPSRPQRRRSRRPTSPRGIGTARGGLG